MTFLEEAIISGFIGEVASRCVDVSWTKIKEAVKNRKNKHQNIESQIYNVITNVLNQITYNKFENDQDMIYQVAEKLLLSYKDAKCDNIETVIFGLQVFGVCVNDNKYMEFKGFLYQELCKKDYEELYRQIRLLQHDVESNKTSRIEQKVDNLEYGIREANEKLDSFKRGNESDSVVHEHDNKFQNNKKQKYIENWNSRLFLHIDNDENPITLADAFIMPDYEMHKSTKRIGFSDNDSFERIIDKFIKYDRTSTLLITGVPGIGKSTISSWIANKYKDDDKVIVLRFRDWESEELEKGLFRAIYNILKCNKKDLEKKILVLDGFDEIKALDIRDRLLNDFFMYIKDFENLKCIITSRPAYINSYYFDNVVELLHFDINKIRDFYLRITGLKLNEQKIDQENLNIIGIPVILYMAAMSGIDISENPSKPELYNRIFAEKGGIFDKFCKEGVGYSEGKQILRDPENIRKFLDFLGDTAFKMFEKNELFLLKEECSNLRLKFEESDVSILEFPIKHLFENTESNIEFIHKSIFEYFVSEYIFLEIWKGMVSKEGLASTLSYVLKKRELPIEILEFLKYKFIRKLEIKVDLIVEAFNLMLQNGMTYYLKGHYKNIIEHEIHIFVNMLEVVHFWEKDCLRLNDSIKTYLLYNTGLKLNLRSLNMSNYDLKGVNLQNADLQNANLQNANLSGANLSNAKMDNANLKGAKLIDAILFDISLYDVILDGVALQGARIRAKDLKGAIYNKEKLQESDFTGINLLK